MTAFADITVTDEYDKLWYDCLEYIHQNCQDDSLYQNYLNLNKKDFISIAVAIENSSIVAFGITVNT